MEDQWEVAINRFDKYTKQLNDEWDLNNNSKCYSHARIYDGTPLAYYAPVSALLIGNKGWYHQEDLMKTPSKVPLSTYLIKKGHMYRVIQLRKARFFDPKSRFSTRVAIKKIQI